MLGRGRTELLASAHSASSISWGSKFGRVADYIYSWVLRKLLLSEDKCVVIRI